MSTTVERGARPWLVLGICCMSLLIVSLDTTIVNVALPTIRRDLHASVSEPAVDDRRLLARPGEPADALRARPPTGSAGARIFKTGLGLFTAGSLLCSVAPSVELLIVFRMLQAVGGSMLNPVAMSIIRNTFTDPRERARAIGVWGGVIGVSMALGPVLGGALVDASAGARSSGSTSRSGSPPSCSPRCSCRSRARRTRAAPTRSARCWCSRCSAASPTRSSRRRRGLDVAADARAVRGRRPSRSCGSCVYEPRRREPLIELRFFRSLPFSAATVIAVSAFAAFGGFLFLNTLYLQEARGLSPLSAGLYLLPMAG